MNWVKAKHAAETQLEKGELLRWFGWPQVWPFVVARARFALWGAVFSGLALFWVVQIYQGRDPFTRIFAAAPLYSIVKGSTFSNVLWYAGLLAGAGCLGIGLLALVSVGLHFAVARATVYAVTDRRVFVVTYPVSRSHRFAHGLSAHCRSR
jgi:hypothetical protein